MSHPDDRLVRQHRRRTATLVAIVITVTAVAASDSLYRSASSVIAAVGPFLERHELAGAIVFVLLSALSAMVFFFSTAVVTPIAVDAFGALPALLLLWIGWVIGGVSAYAVGRLLGRRVVSWFIEPSRLRDYERRAHRLVSFRHVLLFQLAVPSEIPGYVLGLARCRFRTFITAMAIGELPFAIGAIYLGESFLERRLMLVFAIGIAGVALSWIAFRFVSATLGHAGSGSNEDQNRSAA